MPRSGIVIVGNSSVGSLMLSEGSGIEILNDKPRSGRSIDRVGNSSVGSEIEIDGSRIAKGNANLHSVTTHQQRTPG